MSTITLMIVAGPALSLLLVSAALVAGIAGRRRTGEARLSLLRGLTWAFSAVLAVYLGVQVASLTNSNFQDFTFTACLPVVVLGAGAAAAIWHTRNLKRRVAAVGNRPTTTH